MSDMVADSDTRDTNSDEITSTENRECLDGLDQQVNRSVDKQVLLTSMVRRGYKRAGSVISDSGKKVVAKTKHVNQQISSTVTDYSAVVLPFLGDITLLKYLGKLTQSAATSYDKAMDQVYIQTAIGGSYHRLFDGGHDLLGAWDAAKRAATENNDRFNEQVIGYVSAVWKDVTTVRGLPYVTVSKDSFDVWVDRLEWIPGVKRQYLADLISFDAMEILSCSLASVAVFFALSKEDTDKLSNILGSMGITSIASANPLMAIFTISMTAYAFSVKKMECNRLEMAKSSTLTLVSLSMFSVLGLALLPNLIVVSVVTQLLKTQVLDNQSLHKLLIDYAHSSKAPVLSMRKVMIDSLNNGLVLGADLTKRVKFKRIRSSN